MAGFAGWTPVYDELVRRAYREAGAKRIARVLGIPAQRVRARASALGVSSARERAWDAESVDTLVAMTAHGRTAESCARALGRTKGAVASKRRELRKKGIL